jgi:GT2 family glycosyltransferase
LGSNVYVIVLNWNGWTDTAACLRSLARMPYPSYRVLVIDNGSTDDSASRIREGFPQVEVIETGRNLGFAGGCNVGIRHALARGADFVWLLNNDTTVDSGALQALVDKAQTDPRIGAVGSVIYFMEKPECMQCWGGGYVNFWLGKSGHYVEAIDDDKVEFITGCSLLTPRRAIEGVGVLDEGFFMYWEDSDFCFRLRSAGWHLAVAEESKVWHKGHTSIGKGKISSYRSFNASAARFFRKHAPVPVFFWVGFALRLGKRLLMGDWEKLQATWVGMKQGRTASMPQR